MTIDLQFALGSAVLTAQLHRRVEELEAENTRLRDQIRNLIDADEALLNHIRNGGRA